MRVPFEWLKELIHLSLDPQEVAAKLTMLGLEVESMEEMHDDTVLEVNVTPNRPDCLSMLGIAREISALLNAPLKIQKYQIEQETDVCPVHVEIADDDLCHRYAGRDIRGIRIGDSPDWMKKRLEKCGMRPINNIVDITNYVLLEMGHPLHAFDRDKLKGKKIRVAQSQPGTKITTLDGIERVLPDDALLIWDAEHPVAVAGVMGGSESEVTDATKNVFLESAYFLPSSIRRTSKALGLKTESSYRFERGTDIEHLDKALDRAALLMSEIASGQVSKKVDIYPRPFRPSRIEVRYERVNKMIGTSIAGDEMVNIVERIGMKGQKNSTSFTVTPPPYRTDIQREIDIVEEIARFHGYDRIPLTIPKMQISGAARDKRYGYIETIKESLKHAGFTEAINYSFMNYHMLDLLDISNNDRRRKALTLRNPINTEESHLRTILVPSLIQNLVFNVSMGIRDIRLFEVSRIFLDQGQTLPEEEHHLGAIYFREKVPSLWKDETPDFYLVKGVIESFMDELRISDYAFQPSSEPLLHPGKSCDIMVSGEKTGFLGVLHPAIIEKLALKVSRSEILILDVNLDRCLTFVPAGVKYTPIPKYPPIDRDIALVVDETLPALTIMERMRAYPTELIEDISIFDFYKGKNIPEGKKSLAFSIRYRAKDRTLTDSEIEELHSRLIRHITEKTGGVVRGT
ncbi:MAG TPA: phenylalanine--tRNA ligase subunit beta [Nitrospiraceae bacterium]|nr:phenylalanine--tRNA ligase subunit beta [Nitrospiraceae bacterium]